MIKIIFVLLAFTSLQAYAFPEMIRHGYTNCTACHISISGGGALNQYGKNLSKDALSTWSYKGEENVLHGLVDTESVKDWLVIGGDNRVAQVHQDNDNLRRGRTIKMQAGIELGINQPKWAFVSYIGEFEEEYWHAYSPKYYALYRLTDEVALRAGRFIPTFGVNIPDHILSTRGPIGFGYGTEKDTVEASWLSENWNLIGSYYKTPLTKSDKNNSGYTGTLSKIFNDTYKFSLQYLNEKSDTVNRSITGINGLFGWTENLYTTVEYDRSSTEILGLAAPKTQSHYFLHKTGYEFFKGFHGIILNDYSQADIDIGATKNYKYGPGLQWYPRPHLDIQLYWTKQQSSQNIIKDGDYAWMVFHYYL